MNQQHKTVVSTALGATIGIAGIYFVYNLYKRKLFQKISNLWADPIKNAFKYREIHIANTIEECKEITFHLKRNCAPVNVLGFDCEWVVINGTRHPVALLQLATHTGYCALIRLCNLRIIPKELKELLEDETIIKVGVAPSDDAQKLSHDYDIGVASTLDLRYLASYFDFKPEGLAKMSQTHLNIKLNKHWRITCSNWADRELDDAQIKYAADDAQAAIELFKYFQNIIKQRNPIWKLNKNKKSLGELLLIAEPYLDLKYAQGNAVVTAILNKAAAKKKFIKPFNYNLGVVRRSKPFYDNCLLEAPDGELLCVCDKKKAEWYINKNVAQLICESPYTVRLNFEPAGRSVGEVGRYYQEPKLNQCVVCGKNDSFIRKNVVPREYRKYFPPVMKEHTSHDVLLLCPQCHQRSNLLDICVRRKLEKICDAPIYLKKTSKMIEDPNLRPLKSIARALLNHKHKIPENRLSELRTEFIKYYTPDTVITNELLEEAANVNTLLPNTEYCAHGKQVVDYYTNKGGGLVQLEILWRQHFLKTMAPKFLPVHWSINHNAERLKIRYDEGRIDNADVIIAGINNNTENLTTNNNVNGDGIDNNYNIN